jgi:cysteine-rich repeat protein
MLVWCRAVSILLVAFHLALVSPAQAAKLALNRSFTGVDWTSAGVSGVGQGSGDITLSEVNGPVSAAFLYWHGLGTLPGDGEYQNDVVSIDGNEVTGTEIGRSSTNCWGDGESTAFVADVTAYVAGNGTYAITGLASRPTHQANGASLVVIFDDGDPSNNVDLLFYEGNDSNERGGPEEDTGWHEYLTNIDYPGGRVRVQFHVADGQSFDDDELRYITDLGSLTIPDTASHYDGNSVPSAGFSRAAEGDLWDIHTFDITAAFRGRGRYNLTFNGQERVEDCIGLILFIFEFAPNAAGDGCGDGSVRTPEECDDGNRIDGDCCSSTCQFEPAGTLCGAPGDPCIEPLCDGAGTCDVEGKVCRAPLTPRAGQLALRHGPNGRSRNDQFTWRWSDGITSVADLGDPLNSTQYDLCVYDTGTGTRRLLSHLSLPPGGTCSGLPCWRATTTGYEYLNPAGPLQQLVLRGGLPGEATILARSTGAGATTMVPPLPMSPTVMVRLRASTGKCWRANFSRPQKNGKRRFKSRSDYFHP